MKRITAVIAVTAGLLLAATTLATAQDNAPAGKKQGQTVEQQLDRMTKALTLTDAQKPKVKAVLEETTKKRQELAADTSLRGQERREKMTALMEQQSAKLKPILTPEQFKTYQERQAEMRDRARKGGEGKGGGKGKKQG